MWPVTNNNGRFVLPTHLTSILKYVLLMGREHQDQDYDLLAIADVDGTERLGRLRFLWNLLTIWGIAHISRCV
jgi:hypothetical protein